ncbi:Hypothetical predicted protein [Pelobates cultripes]|uniref:Uncharacterized protein n=1 Tax=Pelobates cultripes TaxID=61616 RepID=A0AAD1W4U7_PELCU|nr:Hypothetical predicted protein [Pelobates cultripes]
MNARTSSKRSAEPNPELLETNCDLFGEGPDKQSRRHKRYRRTDPHSGRQEPNIPRKMVALAPMALIEIVNTP